MRFLLSCFVVILLLFGILTVFAQSPPPLQVGVLGDFVLESGETIKDCHITYRAFGTCNRDSSNVILFPTWFGGRSEDLAFLIGPDLLVNDEKYYIIAVDALGNGNSSSPSNSREQPGKAFPQFSIRDMVRSQFLLVRQELDITHLFGIIGGSMGGMQVFQWIVTYPDFMDRAVAYVGSPRLTSYDLLIWNTERMVIDEGRSCGMAEAAILRMIASIQTMVIQTPGYRARTTPVQEFHTFLARTIENYRQRFNTDDWYSQLCAMMAHDVTRPFGGSMQKAAEQVKAQLFIIVCDQDHIVNPGPALEFAGMIHARTLRLNSDCGHLAVGCEMDRVSREVQNFWETGVPRR